MEYANNNLSAQTALEPISNVNAGAAENNASFQQAREATIMVATESAEDGFYSQMMRSAIDTVNRIPESITSSYPQAVEPSSTVNAGPAEHYNSVLRRLNMTNYSEARRAAQLLIHVWRNHAVVEEYPVILERLRKMKNAVHRGVRDCDTLRILNKRKDILTEQYELRFDELFDSYGGYDGWFAVSTELAEMVELSEKKDTDVVKQMYVALKEYELLSDVLTRLGNNEEVEFETVGPYDNA